MNAIDYLANSVILATVASLVLSPILFSARTAKKLQTSESILPENFAQSAGIKISNMNNRLGHITQHLKDLDQRSRTVILIECTDTGEVRISQDGALSDLPQAHFHLGRVISKEFDRLDRENSQAQPLKPA